MKENKSQIKTDLWTTSLPLFQTKKELIEQGVEDTQNWRSLKLLSNLSFRHLSSFLEWTEYDSI